MARKKARVQLAQVREQLVIRQHELSRQLTQVSTMLVLCDALAEAISPAAGFVDPSPLTLARNAVHSAVPQGQRNDPATQQLLSLAGHKLSRMQRQPGVRQTIVAWS